jgi:nucleoid-associated protein YgaU
MDSPFPITSRYAAVEVAHLELPDGATIPYLRRRFVPAPERFAALEEHTVTQGERLDHIAAARLGDPERFWLICDANRAVRPTELLEVGLRLRITLPADIPAPATEGGGA